VNHNELKKISRKELLKLLPEDIKFKTVPWTHQIAPLVCCIAYDGFLLALDLGTGKSKVAIDCCSYMAQSGRTLKVLVICLNSAVENWQDEIHMHSDSRTTCLRGNSEEKWKALSGVGFFIVNYESMRAWLSKKVETKKGKNKQIIDPAKFRRIQKFGFDVLIVDESHKIKSVKSLNYRMALSIQRNINKRMLLTGTPFGNTLLDIWPQYFIVDRGETYNANYYSFRKAYFEDKGFWGPDWRVTRAGKKIIESKLFNKAIRYNESEIEDLPMKVYRAIKYRLSAEQEKAYDDAFEGFDELGGTLANKTTVFRQICGGSMKSTQRIFKDNSKLEAVREVVLTIVSGGNKAVIFYEFRLEFDILKKMLKKEKIKFNIINGDVKDKHAEYTNFNNNPKYKVCLVQPKSGGASINLVSANYCLIYSNSYSIIDRKQLEKRTHRSGQTAKRCFFYDFIGVNTIEAPILKALNSGKDFFSSAIDGKSIKKLLRGRK
jgi:SWI/SNF-related matrix-associated actin-dependent regulator 1 of chromatin subfamily A